MRDARRRQAAEASLSIYAWADRELLIPRGSGMVPHRSDVTPYFRYALDLVRDRVDGTGPGADVESITFITATQVGKTFGFLVPTLTWLAALHPRDTAVILPSHDAAKRFFRNKLKRTFEQSPRLADLLPIGAAERATRLGQKAWLLAEMTLHAKNGAVALDLRGDDLPVMLWDEFDALPTNVDGEGSPLVLGSDRQKTFPTERLAVRITTPTDVQGLGWSSFVAGTCERLFVACRGCKALDWLNPAQLVGLDAADTLESIHAGDRARWACRFCGNLHTSDDRTAMVRAACRKPGVTAAGGWIPGAWSQDPEGRGVWTTHAKFDDKTGHLIEAQPAVGTHRTLWLNALYSEFISLGRFLAEDRRTAAASAHERQAFVNGWLAEPFSARVESASAEHVTRLKGVAGDGYQLGQCPMPMWRIGTFYDQQGMHAEKSWFPFITRAVNQNGDSRLIDTGQIDGFANLELHAAKTWSIGGVVRKADVIGIDSANGPMLPVIAKWCMREKGRRLAISGSGTFSPDHPYSERRPTHKTLQRFHGLPVMYSYNSHMFRDFVFDRMRGAEGEPAWLLPPDVPDWYVESLQSEERVPDVSHLYGRIVNRYVWKPREWVDPQGRLHVRNDNHWWDCEVGWLALLTILGWFAEPKPRAGIIFPRAN